MKDYGKIQNSQKSQNEPAGNLDAQKDSNSTALSDTDFVEPDFDLIKDELLN